MKPVGIIGGMSWESSQLYYQIMNREVRDRLGGSSSADIIMHSLNFAEIAKLQHEGAWDELSDLLTSSARGLENAGAGCIVIATNTMHKLADDVSQAVDIPLLHIGDSTGQALANLGSKKPLLLGTLFTMEGDFYRSYIEERFDTAIMLPGVDDRKSVHRIIYQELVNGIIENRSRDIYRDIIEKSSENGADAVIMGCTEITMLIDQSDCAVPLLDTTLLHALSAVDFMLS